MHVFLFQAGQMAIDSLAWNGRDAPNMPIIRANTHTRPAMLPSKPHAREWRYSLHGNQSMPDLGRSMSSRTSRAWAKQTVGAASRVID